MGPHSSFWSSFSFEDFHVHIKMLNKMCTFFPVNMFYVSLIFRLSHRTLEDKRIFFSSIHLYWIRSLVVLNSLWNKAQTSQQNLPTDHTLSFYFHLFHLYLLNWLCIPRTPSVSWLFFPLQEIFSSFKPTDSFSFINTFIKITSCGNLSQPSHLS